MIHTFALGRDCACSVKHSLGHILNLQPSYSSEPHAEISYDCNAIDFDWTHMMRSWDRSLMPCYLTVLSLRRKVWTWHRWIIFQSSQSCTWQDLVLIHAGDAFNPWWPFQCMLTLEDWTTGAWHHSKTTSAYHNVCLCSLLWGAASWTFASLPRFVWELPPMLLSRILRLRLHSSVTPILVVSSCELPNQLLSLIHISEPTRPY